MLNLIWGLMILFGIAFSAFTGKIPQVTTAVIESAKESVNICITMLGIVAMWSGLMGIAEKSGMVLGLTNKMSPLLSFLFPNIPKTHKARKYIATNFIANFLGLGWAATPAGLKAMEELQKINKNKKIASNEMCVFLIINMSSVQLVSVNLLSYRMNYNSANPAEIIGPCLLATAFTTALAILICKIMERRCDK